MSSGDSSSDVSPIFRIRLVDESAGIMNGGLAHCGNCDVTPARRSWTSCRAWLRSVPRLKYSLIDDTCSTEYERISSSPSTPFSASSIGIVMSSSTSVEEFPVASVCTSMIGGANSGKTSVSASLVWRKPNTSRTAAPNTASHLYRRLRPTIHRIARIPPRSWMLVEDLVLGRQQLRGARGDDRGGDARAVRQHRLATVYTNDLHRRADVGLRLALRVARPCAPLLGPRRWSRRAARPRSRPPSSPAARRFP